MKTAIKTEEISMAAKTVVASGAMELLKTILSTPEGRKMLEERKSQIFRKEVSA